MADDTETQGDVDHGAANERLTEPPSDEVQQEIEEERERRLTDENRSENTEIDNSDATLPTVEAFDAEQPESVAGTSDPSESFRENPPSDEEVKEIEEERERRLADENRPEGAVIDNTGDESPTEEES